MYELAGLSLPCFWMVYPSLRGQHARDSQCRDGKTDIEQSAIWGYPGFRHFWKQSSRLFICFSQFYIISLHHTSKMKLDARDLRYVSTDEFKVLSAVSLHHRNLIAG